MYQWYILNPLKGWIWIQTLTKIWVSPLMLPWLPHDMFTYRHLPTRSPTYIYLKQIHFTVFFKSVQRATWLSALTCGAPCNTFPVGSLIAAFESIIGEVVLNWEVILIAASHAGGSIFTNVVTSPTALNIVVGRGSVARNDRWTEQSGRFPPNTRNRRSSPRITPESTGHLKGPWSPIFWRREVGSTCLFQFT